MQFIGYLRIGSFSHRMGRAKNLARVLVEGIPFYWEGSLQRYQSDVMEDPGKLLNHPSVDLAGFGVPPEPQGTGPDLWVGPGDSPSGIPRKKKGRVVAGESQVGG